MLGGVRAGTRTTGAWSARAAMQSRPVRSKIGNRHAEQAGQEFLSSTKA